jgi:hypothetical protein
MEKEKLIIKYFLGNIFEAKSHYTEWKMIHHARSVGILSKEMAERYTEIQKQAGSFFTLTERACLVSFVIFISHIFDKRSDSMSLEKVDRKSYQDFYKDNKIVIDQLKKARDNIFAHRNIQIDPKEIIIPSIDDLDKFFSNLEKLYNSLSSKIDNSSAWFDNVEYLKREIELVYMNLERGETVRRKEIDIEWKWEKSSDKISDKI